MLFGIEMWVFIGEFITWIGLLSHFSWNSWSQRRPTLSYGIRRCLYGIRRCLIGVGSITEVRQRRTRLIIGWVTAWDCQVPYTLGHRAAMSCRVVGLREPSKSDGSSDRLCVGRKRTSMDVGAVFIRRDPRKSTMWNTWNEHKAKNYIMNDKRPC